MEYTLFQDFARKIPRLAPPTDRPGRAQSGRAPEFGYGPLTICIPSFLSNYLFNCILLCLYTFSSISSILYFKTQFRPYIIIKKVWRHNLQLM